MNESLEPEAVRLGGGNARGDKVVDGGRRGDYKYNTIMTMATATEII